MTIPNMKNVQRVLIPIEHQLYEIPIKGWEDWLEISKIQRTRFSRTRANWVWDRMIEHAYDLFSQNSKIRPIERFHSVSFIVDNQVLIRFKKGDLKGLTRNYPTQLALEFHNHEKLLFGEIDFDRVELVYILNDLETQIERICVVARNNSKIVWDYDVKPKEAVVKYLPIDKIEKTPPEDLVEGKDEERKDAASGEKE